MPRIELITRHLPESQLFSQDDVQQCTSYKPLIIFWFHALLLQL